MKKVVSNLKSFIHKMQFKEKLLKLLAWVLTISMLNLTACFQSFFKVSKPAPPANSAISSLNSTGKSFIIHFENEKWNLTKIQINDQTLTGKITEYKMAPTIRPVKTKGANRYYTRAAQDQRYLLNEVHIYMGEFAKSENNQVTIPLSSINRIDVYDKETASTVGSYVLGSLGILAGAYLALGLIILLFKESCPFVYTWDGFEYRFAGEIYSGSIHKPLERNDYLKLPYYSGDEKYTLKITNEVKEIQHTNLAELMVVDHPKGTTVLIDKNGNIHTITELTAPVKATNYAGTDVTKMVTEKEDSYYQTPITGPVLPERDALVLEFPGSHASSSVKLAIRAKNSILADYMMGEFHDLFGNGLDNFMKRQQNAPAERQRQWSLDQGIPLALYVERNNRWEFADYYNIAGPMAFKEDILDIPLTGKESEPLKIKLDYGACLWEIDYTAISYPSSENTTSYTIKAESAINEDQVNVTRLITNDDKKYYTQPEMDNEAVFTFKLPPHTDSERSIFLHSKGWYQILRNPEGKPDMDYIYTFREPGQLNKFINEELTRLRTLITP